MSANRKNILISGETKELIDKAKLGLEAELKQSLSYNEYLTHLALMCLTSIDFLTKGSKLLEKRQKMKADIRSFIAEYGLFIHPQRDLNDWVDGIIEDGGCAGDPQRPSCPCDKALGEIIQRGACVYTVLVNQEYLERFGFIKRKGA